MKRFFLLLFLFSMFLFFLSISFFPDEANLIPTAGIHLGLFSLSMFFLWKTDLKTTLKSMGFPGDWKTTFVFTIAGLFLIFAALLVFTIFSSMMEFNDQAKVSEKIADLPLIVLSMAVLLAPVTEELFFRATLVPKIGDFFLNKYHVPHLGILFSSLIFGIFHFAYGSVVEVVGVFIVALILASIFRITKSISPCIAIHMIYNLLSIIVMRLYA